jgi:membrane-associated phospholipid phosphatase
MNMMPVHIRSYCATVLLLLLATGSYAQNADIRLLRSINSGRSKGLDGAMNVVTKSVYPIAIALPVTELIIGYAGDNKQMKISGWQTIAGLGVNTLLTSGMKYTINRKRPYLSYPDIIPYKIESDPCFPSGHTSYAFNTATSLSICFPKWYVIAPGFAWAAVVGYSRMELGEHYPTDVLTGAVVGCGSAWLSYEGNKWLQRHRKKKD